MVASGFTEWMFFAFREDTIQSQLGHIQIVRPGYHAAGKSDPYAFLLPDAIPELDATHGKGLIKTIAPRLSFSGLVSHGDDTLSFIGDGVSPEEEAAFAQGVLMSSGQNLIAAEPRTAILGEGLARNLGVAVGDRIILVATATTGGTNAVELTIRGLFSTVSKSYDDVALRIPIQTARELLRTKGSHTWIVLLNDTAHTNVMVQNLKRRFAHEKLDVVPWYELADIYNKTAALFEKQVQGVRLIIALIILLSISNTLTISVLERTGEIGTALALGVTRRGVMRLFLTEGVLLGCLGGLLGVVTGIAAAYAITAIGIPMPPPPGVAHGYTIEVFASLTIALESLVLALAATLLASLYPAWSASKKEVVDALRYNR
jgi:putative ABC transport system permease protein